MFFNASLISEYFLTLNRFFEIIKKKTCLGTMSKKLILFVSFFVALLISLPLYFTADIVKGKTNGTFVKQASEFGSSKFLTYYSIFILVLTVAAIIILFLINVVSIYKFKLFLERHAHLTNNQTQAKKREIRFTKMTLILTTICVLSRTFDLIAIFLNRPVNLNSAQYSTDYIKLTSLLRDAATLFIYTVHAFDGLLYLKMDTNLWKLILKILRLDQVKIHSIINIFLTKKDKFLF